MLYCKQKETGEELRTNVSKQNQTCLLYLILYASLHLYSTAFTEKCQGGATMLRGTNNQKLLDEGLKEKHLLFYQLWKELTESKTFDTYQNHTR